MSNFDPDNDRFKSDLRKALRCIYTSENFPRNGEFSADRMRSTIFSNFESFFADILTKHAPLKKKIVRENHSPYMTKRLRKAIILN